MNVPNFLLGFVHPVNIPAYVHVGVVLGVAIPGHLSLIAVETPSDQWGLQVRSDWVSPSNGSGFYSFPALYFRDVGVHAVWLIRNRL